MPTIIKNGRNYSGTSVSLTQAEYDALPEVTKMNGTTYFITDSDVVLDADNVALGNGTVEDLAGSVAVIETETASANRSVGDHILLNGQLYTVTSQVATGETFVVGTNITATNVGAELTALNNGLIVPLMSNTEFHAVNRTIAQGSYYECPVDGFYSWAVYGGSNATAMLFLDSDNNITKAIYASDTDNANHIVSFPFKAGTKVYTRSSFGNYVVKGYWAL